MDATVLQTHSKLILRQKITPMVNRYVVSTESPDGSEGSVVAFAEQKRLTLKEQVTFYTDETRAEALASFKARKVIDLASGYDVVDASGTSIGMFRKDFGKSLLRSTWHVQQPGLPTYTGTERRLVGGVVTALRRLAGVAALPLRLQRGRLDRVLGGPQVGPARQVRHRDQRPETGPPPGHRDGGGAWTPCSRGRAPPRCASRDGGAVHTPGQKNGT